MEIRRKVKNVVYKYSEAEKVVREATSNDPWGPSTTMMSEIADMTHHYSAFEDIMQLIWKRLNDKGKNWRHVYKSLVLLEYLIKCGDQKVSEECMRNIHTIQTLKDFQYFEDHKDLGIGVREKSKTLVALLKDPDLLRSEQEKGKKVKEKFHAQNSSLGSHQRRRPGELGREIRKQFTRDHPTSHHTVMKLNFDDKKDDEDEEFQKAIALSKEEHERTTKKRLDEERMEDLKLKMAMEQSKKEEEALAVLRPPPQMQKGAPTSTLFDLSVTVSSSDNKIPQQNSLYKLSEASRIFELNGGLDGIDIERPSDPWGDLYNRAGDGVPKQVVEFDPWETPNHFDNHPIDANNFDSLPMKESAAPSKSIIDDIFGDEKPDTKFAYNLNFGNSKQTYFDKHDSLYDPWQDSNISDNKANNRTKISGSLASLTDIGNDVSGEKMQHSLSVMNLFDSSKKKTPHEFLGENANLVNLDNLLPIPKAGVYRDPYSRDHKNPFGGGSGTTQTSLVSNPFNNAQTKVPMNQMASNPQATLFSSSGNLVAMQNSQFGATQLSFNPLFPNSQSQYQGFPMTFNAGATAYTGWPPLQGPVNPPNQWSLINSNNASSVTPNPFF